MLITWGGNGLDTISEEEFNSIGKEKCEEYCDRYCWKYGYGNCSRCALDKARQEGRCLE